MGMDSMEELGGYDDVDADQVFNGGQIAGNRGGMGEGRRKGKKSLSSRNNYRARSKRPMGRGFSFNFRGFEDTAKMMLAVSIGTLLICGVILYATFGMHLLPDFYGALLASIVVMALLFYTAMKLVRTR
ncbi:hypothetical protein MCP_0277 [Methanocella paludicola SANAE]|uniref:Uncharacterized protein n=1 Tax=Methanocella paludicola (strain DSM 17711 / JCM 13418 / NBRC 101707 / SANAE) TaxID=304371 RepID=D1YV77_METPS|nr:hypothetical protein [Methanocella paludicola]BAI60349.1 hypothetical protein MCP_0277 [Methanocella paludicola SANAE]